MSGKRNKEGIVIRAARFLWKALTIFLAIQSAPSVAAAPLRGTTEYIPESTTRVVNGILRAELGDLCAQATAHGPVPCNERVHPNQLKKIDAYGTEYVPIDISIRDTFFDKPEMNDKVEINTVIRSRENIENARIARYRPSSVRSWNKAFDDILRDEVRYFKNNHNQDTNNKEIFPKEKFMGPVHVTVAAAPDQLVFNRKADL